MVDGVRRFGREWTPFIFQSMPRYEKQEPDSLFDKISDDPSEAAQEVEKLAGGVPKTREQIAAALKGGKPQETTSQEGVYWEFPIWAKEKEVLSRMLEEGSYSEVLILRAERLLYLSLLNESRSHEDFLRRVINWIYSKQGSEWKEKIKSAMLKSEALKGDIKIFLQFTSLLTQAEDYGHLKRLVSDNPNVGTMNRFLFNSV